MENPKHSPSGRAHLTVDLSAAQPSAADFYDPSLFVIPAKEEDTEDTEDTIGQTLIVNPPLSSDSDDDEATDQHPQVAQDAAEYTPAFATGRFNGSPFLRKYFTFNNFVIAAAVITFAVLTGLTFGGALSVAAMPVVGAVYKSIAGAGVWNVAFGNLGSLAVHKTALATVTAMATGAALLTAAAAGIVASFKNKFFPSPVLLTATFAPVNVPVPNLSGVNHAFPSQSAGHTYQAPKFNRTSHFDVRNGIGAAGGSSVLNTSASAAASSSSASVLNLTDYVDNATAATLIYRRGQNGRTSPIQLPPADGHGIGPALAQLEDNTTSRRSSVSSN